MNTHSTLRRVATALVAGSATAVVLASQLMLVVHYAQPADTALSQQQVVAAPVRSA